MANFRYTVYGSNGNTHPCSSLREAYTFALSFPQDFPLPLFLSQTEKVESGGMSWRVDVCACTLLGRGAVKVPVAHDDTFLSVCSDLGLSPEFKQVAHSQFHDEFGNFRQAVNCNVYSINP